MGEYKRGEVDITANQKVFDGFVRAAVWVGGFSIAVLVFLAIFNS